MTMRDRDIPTLENGADRLAQSQQSRSRSLEAQTVSLTQSSHVSASNEGQSPAAQVVAVVEAELQRLASVGESYEDGWHPGKRLVDSIPALRALKMQLGSRWPKLRSTLETRKDLFIVNTNRDDNLTNWRVRLTNQARIVAIVEEELQRRRVEAGEVEDVFGKHLGAMAALRDLKNQLEGSRMPQLRPTLERRGDLFIVDANQESNPTNWTVRLRTRKGRSWMTQPAFDSVVVSAVKAVLKDTSGSLPGNQVYDIPEIKRLKGDNNFVRGIRKVLQRRKDVFNVTVVSKVRGKERWTVSLRADSTAARGVETAWGDIDAGVVVAWSPSARVSSSKLVTSATDVGHSQSSSSSSSSSFSWSVDPGCSRGAVGPTTEQAARATAHPGPAEEDVDPLSMFVEQVLGSERAADVIPIFTSHGLAVDDLSVLPVDPEKLFSMLKVDEATTALVVRLGLQRVVEEAQARKQREKQSDFSSIGWGGASGGADLNMREISLRIPAQIGSKLAFPESSFLTQEDANKCKAHPKKYAFLLETDGSKCESAGQFSRVGVGFRILFGELVLDVVSEAGDELPEDHVKLKPSAKNIFQGACLFEAGRANEHRPVLSGRECEAVAFVCGWRVLGLYLQELGVKFGVLRVVRHLQVKLVSQLDSMRVRNAVIRPDVTGLHADQVKLVTDAVQDVTSQHCVDADAEDPASYVRWTKRTKLTEVHRLAKGVVESQSQRDNVSLPMKDLYEELWRSLWG